MPSPAAPLTPTPGRRPLLAVLVATFFVRLGFGLTLAVFASYIVGRSTGLEGSDVGAAGLISAMAPVGEFSTVLLSGALADRYGRWPILFSGMAAAAILFAVAATTRDRFALGAINLVFGIASGAILAASLAVVGDRADESRRGYEMGRFDAMNLFGWVGGFALGFGLLGILPNDRLGLVFAGGSVALAAGLALTAGLLRGARTYHGTQSYNLRNVLRNVFRRSVLLVTLPWLVIYMLIGTALVFLGTAAQGIGISTTSLALVIGGGGAILVVTQPYYGGLADRFGRNRLMTIGATGFVGTMVFASLLLAYGVEDLVLIGLGVSVIMALAYGPAALAALADLTFEMSRATTMSIYSLTISLGMLVGLIASTGLYSRYGNPGIYLFFGLVSTGLILLTVARLREDVAIASVAPTTPAR
ncbi:MAG: MFS transporter [Thermoplasmata archaeon]|nr:MFS transporter [Thermoplasmata archaeon]